MIRSTSPKRQCITLYWWKNWIDPKVLLSKNAGERYLLSGNEAIARGAIEAGVKVVTTYPGTPSSEIADNLSDVAKDAGIYMEYSTNEIVAVEVAAGASLCGVRAFSCMKHVGLNVASDALGLYRLERHGCEHLL